MTVCWQKLIGKLTIWLALEILLNLIGIDDMADYVEFVFEKSGSTISVVNACLTMT